MARTSSLPEHEAAPALTDWFIMVDRSDLTEAPTGTTKKIRAEYVGTGGGVGGSYVQNAPGQTWTLWGGTQAAYDALAVKSPTTIYIITASVPAATPDTIWAGTLAAYNAIAVKDASTLYLIT
jgi:hypothetical protein